MADLEQWVNIARADKWVEDDVASVERLGPVHIECKFKKALPAAFKFKVEPKGSPATYTDAEMGRNSNFMLRNAQGAYSNDGKKTVKPAQGILLPAAGNNEYTLKAKYQDKEVEASKTIVTRRRLFYQSCTMDGITEPHLASLENEYWATHDCYLKLLKKAGGTMPLIKTIYRDDGAGGDSFTLLCNQTKTAWALQDRMPYAFMIVWANYIADAAQKTIRQTVDVKLPSKLWNWFWKGMSFEFNVGSWLWHGLDDDHDAAFHWFVSMEVKFRDKQGRITRLPIPDDRVDIAGKPQRPHGGYRKIRVDLSADDMAGIRNRYSKREGKLRFEIKVRTVGGMSCGMALGPLNVIAVAAKGAFQIYTDAERKVTLNHELGHKIGMVADGTGRLPDGPATLYGNIRNGPGENNRGHQGPHCDKDATWNAGTKKWSGTPGCVMFGADSIKDGDRVNNAPSTYCDDCNAIVRKLDLSAGMSGFRLTPSDL